LNCIGGGDTLNTLPAKILETETDIVHWCPGWDWRPFPHLDVKIFGSGESGVEWRDERVMLSDRVFEAAGRR
jgi:hypothetical protein